MSPETATLRDLYELVESVREDMNQGFGRMDERLTPVEHYITADRARRETWGAFRSGVLKVMGVVAAVVSAAVAAAMFVLTVARMIV